MKFQSLKTCFKNGMVSPRLRGREKEGDTTNSAEKLENFVVDRIGGVVKRSGLQVPILQPFLNSGAQMLKFDPKPISSSANVKYFAVVLRGKEYIFKFDLSKSINAITQTVSPTTVAHYQSTFLTVLDTSANDNNNTYKDVRPYAPYYTGSASTLSNGDLCAFNKTPDSTPVDTQLQYYLNGLYPIPEHMTKITDASVIFTCADQRNSISNISFSVSLISLPVTTSLSATTEVFVILPYFVNIRAFVANLGKSLAASDYYIPIQPVNFPFNSVNTNSSFSVDTAVFSGQSFPATSNGVLSTPGNKLAYEVTVPKDICIDATYSNATNPDALIGKFIIIPDSSNVRDIVFFITRYETSTSTQYKFNAIQITGGVPETSSTRWRVSSFGGQSHPRAASLCFGRLIYGNAGQDQAKWWASAVHPSSGTSYQNFMDRSLTQDATSDVSHMLYEGIATAGATDIYRYGFSSRVPNLSPINFIESRTKIHFGTSNGETQATPISQDFARFNYDQLKIRTNSASPYATTSGDGKFFYISNGGKDIRYISTEDKYYESLDGLMTTTLEGLGLVFNKIVWYERLNSIVAKTTTNRIFFITIHEDTQVKAISEFISVDPIIDICSSYSNLFFVFTRGGYQHIAKYNPLLHTDLTTTVETNYAGDISCWYPSNVGEAFYEDIYPYFLGSSINIFFMGIEYTLSIPVGYIGTAGSITLPFDPSLMTYVNPAFFYGNRITAKLKTMPLAEGGGNGTSIVGPIRIDQGVVQVDNSGPFKFGMEGGTLNDAEKQTLSPLQTKFVKFDMPQSPDIENHLYIETDKPTPLNISGLAFRGVSYSGE